MLFSVAKEYILWLALTAIICGLVLLAVRAVYVRWMSYEPRPMPWRPRVVSYLLFAVVLTAYQYYWHHHSFTAALTVGILGASCTALGAELGVLIFRQDRLEQIGWMYGFMLGTGFSREWMHDLIRRIG